MLAALTQPTPQPAAAPYGLVYFPELLTGQPDKGALLLPLTFAYLLSMHVRFVLPVSEGAVTVVESILDEVLSGHSLQSKGLVYQTLATGEGLQEVLGSPTMMITSSAGTQAQPWASGIPQAVIFAEEGKGPNVRLRNVEKITDEDLRGKIVGCAQLINIQSGGFMSEGHFSLSW